MIDFFLTLTLSELLLLLLGWGVIVALVCTLIHFGAEDYPYDDDQF